MRSTFVMSTPMIAHLFGLMLGIGCETVTRSNGFSTDAEDFAERNTSNEFLSERDEVSEPWRPDSTIEMPTCWTPACPPLDCAQGGDQIFRNYYGPSEDFQAECNDGVLFAHWVVPWKCHSEDPGDFSYYDCSCHYECPNGCKESPSFSDQPIPTGKDLVKYYCNDCTSDEDCEGRETWDSGCKPQWRCEDGVCAAHCTYEKPCAAEGWPSYVPLECCEGLVSSSCDAPDAQGQCQKCFSHTVCTKCNDGVCGPGENICNCPQDCKECGELGDFVCPPDRGCKCCNGFSPVRQCDIAGIGQCYCEDENRYICIDCGDGVCGPFEQKCNCPQDCPDEHKCVETYKSECYLQSDGQNEDGIVTVEVEGHDLLITHDFVLLNCCLGTNICYLPMKQAILVREVKLGDTPCDCKCPFTIRARLEGIPSDVYVVSIYNEELERMVYSEVVSVP